MIAELTTITKRDGRQVPFDEERIRTAVLKCLTNGVGMTPEASGSIADLVTCQVVNILHASDKPITVEHVQDVVEMCLMGCGEYAAARQYILYREDRARARELVPIADPEYQALVEQDQQYFPHPIQRFQALSKYARWIEEKGRRETWSETAARVISFFRKNVKHASSLPEQDWQDLEQAILTQQAMPAMRVIQMAGPAAERENAACYNCASRGADTIDHFVELMYLSMQGCGVGFSVEREFVDDLPKVKRQKSDEPSQFVIEDHTEGWCDALRFGLNTWFGGRDVNFDYSLIRPAGARLKTKGGRASGPEPLRRLLDFVRKTVLAAQGRRLRPIECHDICCMIGDIVHVGGVRRSALISLSDLDDMELRQAKTGQFWIVAPHRARSNNSAVYNEKPSAVAFMEEWLSLAKSGSGERGIFNREGALRHLPKRRKKHAKMVSNPCCEILLRPAQFCNLSIVPARPGDTEETLREKVRLAAIFGTLQSTLTKFNGDYLSPSWRVNCEEERLLGVDITGQVDCPLLQPCAPGREELLERLRDYAIEVNREYAGYLGIPASTAVTTVKPSGNSAQLLGTSSGVHPRYAPYYIRRCEASLTDPVTRMLVDAGVPWVPAFGQDPTHPAVISLEFPMKSPEGAITRNDLTAIEQLENWLVWRKHWAEHTVSVTIYVGEDEWLDVGHWVYQNWEWVSGISFLPRDNGIYACAPYQECSKEEYEKRLSEFPDIPWHKLVSYEHEDSTTITHELACSGGSCDL